MPSERNEPLFTAVEATTVTPPIQDVDAWHELDRELARTRLENWRNDDHHA